MPGKQREGILVAQNDGDRRGCPADGGGIGLACADVSVRQSDGYGKVTLDGP